jgi:hypothetical protein
MRDGRPRLPSVCEGLLLGLWLAAGPGWAGYEERLRAYHCVDYATALREWRPLAQQDHVEAQFALGLIMTRGGASPKTPSTPSSDTSARPSRATPLRKSISAVCMRRAGGAPHKPCHDLVYLLGDLSRL